MFTETPKILLRGTPQKSFFDILASKNIKELFILEGRGTVGKTSAFCKEILKHHITPTFITDNIAGFLFYQDLVKEVWVTYQDVKEEGLVSEAGALMLGVLSRKHRIPLFAVRSKHIVLKIGKPKDILEFFGRTIAPKGTKTFVPLLENLPKSYAKGIY